MNARMLTVLTTATLLVATSGCSGTRNFLFGRGAQCGSCLTLPKIPGLGGNRLGSRLSNPFSSPSCSTCQSGAAIAPPVVSSPHFGSSSCGTCGVPVGDVGCGCGSSGFAPSVNDPYLSSPPINGSIQSSGQIYNGPVYNGQPIYNGADVYNGAGSFGGPSTFQGDNFQSRRFDTDGARILNVEPLPPGVTPVN